MRKVWQKARRMTPFDSYFAAKIAPALTGAPPAAVKLARASAADIWNAALDAVNKNYEDQNAANASTCKPGEAVSFAVPYIEHLRARVTP